MQEKYVKKSTKIEEKNERETERNNIFVCEKTMNRMKKRIVNLQ